MVTQSKLQSEGVDIYLEAAHFSSRNLNIHGIKLKARVKDIDKVKSIIGDISTQNINQGVLKSKYSCSQCNQF